MIIAIAGIKRSGSTVQFNLVRIALEMAGYTVNICGHDYSPREVPPGEVDLVKKHPFDKGLAEATDHIFLTDRDNKEILASLERFNGKKPHPARIADMRKHLDKWKEYTCLVFNYEAWKVDPLMFTSSIVNNLGLKRDVMAHRVLEAFNKIKPPKEGQDPVTLMFSNHITQ